MATKQFEQALEAALRKDEADIYRALIYEGLGDCALKRKHRKDALEYFEKARATLLEIEKKPWGRRQRLLEKMIEVSHEHSYPKVLQSSLHDWLDLVANLEDRGDGKELGYKLYSYGHILIEDERLKKALSLWQRALGLFQSHLGEDHRWSTYTHGRLSELYLDGEDRDLDKAEKHCRLQLKALEKRQGEYSMGLLPVLKTYARIRRLQSELGPSPPPTEKQVLERAIVIVESAEGKDDKDLIPLLYTLALHEKRLARLDQAASKANRAALIAENSGDPSDLSSALPSLFLLFDIAKKRGNKAQADYLQERLAHVYLKSVHIYPERTVEGFIEIAKELVKKGSRNLGIKVLEKSLSRLRGVLGPRSEKVEALERQIREIEG